MSAAATIGAPILGASFFGRELEGGALGVLLAIAAAVALSIAALWLDRRLDRWLARWSRSPVRLLRLAAGRTALLRVGLWSLTLVLALGAAARLSPPLTWVLLPAGALALALAVANLLRDALIGVGHALSRRVKRGDMVQVGPELAGVVVHVSLRILTLRTLDGTCVDIPQRRLASEGIRHLQIEGGGHPVTLELRVPAEIALPDAMREARLAAALAPHAHLGARPTVTTAAQPGTLEVHGVAIDPFHAPEYRAEAALAFEAAMAYLKKRQ